MPFVLDIDRLDFLPSLIEYQFGQFGTVNETIYGSFNAQRLNQSATTINDSLVANNPLSPGYIYATLTAYNATATSNTTNGSPGASSQSSDKGGGGSPNTSLAMSVDIVTS
jgi:hypothetical protein